MYGLPDDLDLSFLIGQQVESIGFGINSIQILSGEGRSEMILTLSSAVWPETGPDFTCNGDPDDRAALAGLVSKTFAGYSASGGDLTFRFAEGDTLTLHEHDTNFESYQISDKDHPGNFLVV